MRFKKGNRWKSSRGELKYRTWRKAVFQLNKAKRGMSKYYVVRSVVKDEKQHECSTLITSRVGKNFLKIDTIGRTEWCCVSTVTISFTESISLKHWINQNYYGSI